MAQLIAITGATGFIGRTLLARMLEQGLQVRALTRRLLAPQPGPAGAVQLVLGDLAQPRALAALVRGADAVVHLAGAIKAHNRAAFMAANRDGVVALADAMRAQAPQARLIYLSSLTAREPALSDYGASKYAGEQALADSGLDWLAIRAPAVYGPADRETLQYFKMIQRGWLLVPGNGSGRLSLIHVQDLADAVIQAASQGWGASARVLEADDGKVGGYTPRNMGAAAAQALGAKVRAVGLPRWLMNGVSLGVQAWAFIRREPQILSPAKVREIFHPDWVSRPPLMGPVLGRKAEFDIVRGFSDAVGWYKVNKWL